MIVINTPHNPTGAVFDPLALKEIVDMAHERVVTVLADEHYCFLPLDGDYILPFLRNLDDRVVATGSIIKCFGTMGLRVGWVIGEPDLLVKVRDWRNYLSHTLSEVSSLLATLILERQGPLLERSRRVVETNLSHLKEWMPRQMGLMDWIEPKGGVVSFPRFDLDMTSDELCQRLIREADVFCLPASSFEMEGHVRLGFGMENNVFIPALERLGDWLSSFRS
jgi:aspartate/methionine/tyrosine aminotransferase